MFKEKIAEARYCGFSDQILNGPRNMITTCVKKFLSLNPLSRRKEAFLKANLGKIASNLNGLRFPRSKVSNRAFKERYTLLSEKFKAEMKYEERESGIECDLSEVEKAPEEIAEKEAAAEGTIENEEKKADNAKAAQMRNRALESLSGTQKRQRNEEEENV